LIQSIVPEKTRVHVSALCKYDEPKPKSELT
jgi:hypothetical protein